MRKFAFAVIALAIGTIFALGAAEIAARMLPVADSLLPLAVNETNPVFRFTPDRSSVWSRDWNFSVVNRVRVNNAGFVNDQDYDENDRRPLLAVVGDSYVEAVMVPYAQTMHGRLAQAVAPEGRVYSFAASGAPLSQYLVWAKAARERWGAQALAVVVVGNDFDESLAVYRQAPGFHLYVEQAAGGLVLHRYDFAPGVLRWFMARSALLRYLLYNLQAHERIRPYLNLLPDFIRPARAQDRAQDFVGNTAAGADSLKIARSRAAIDAFLRDIRDYAGWTPGRVVFVVDGLRYPTDSTPVLSSYFVQMRTYFMAAARKVGFEAIDMDERFFSRARTEKVRFEFPTDGHWNGPAHGIAAEAVAASSVFAQWRRAFAPPVGIAEPMGSQR